MSWGSYGLNLGAPKPPAADPLYAAVPASANPLGNDEAVLREQLGGRATVMTLQVLQALDLCREFAPMDNHVQQVCQGVPGLQGQESAVRGVLEGLAQRELLVTAERWLEQLRAGTSASAAPFRTLIVRTCDRPQSLADLLETLRVHLLRWGRSYRVILVDMSRDPQTVRRNSDALSAFAAAARCHTLHAHRSAQHAFLAELCEALPEHADGLCYLLGDSTAASGFHGDYGVSLNWMNLLGAGERYALLDDDHLFPLRWHAELADGFDLADQFVATRVFATLDEALASGREAESDPLLAHAEVCGMSLAQLLVQGRTRMDAGNLRGLAPSRLPRFGSESRVLASAHGHRGDSCAMSLLWLLTQPAGSRDPILSNAAAYAETIRRPVVSYAANRYRRLALSSLTPFMVDGSALIPPAPPLGRGEDGVFCALIEALHRDSLQIELPLTIGHRRPAAHERGDFLNQPARPALAQVLADHLHSATPELRSGSPEARLRLACAQLEDQAAMSEADAVDYLQGYLLDSRARLMTALRAALLDAPVAPPHLASDLRRLIEANGRALISPEPARFAEWPNEIDAAGGVALWRSYVTRFASALRVWPEAIAVAREKSPRWIEGR